MSSASVALWGNKGRRRQRHEPKNDQKNRFGKNAEEPKKNPENEESPEQRLRGNYEKPICNLTKKRSYLFLICTNSITIVCEQNMNTP